MTPEPIAKLLAALERESALAFQLDRPADPAGQWWIDLEVDGLPTNVSWRRAQGFGLYTADAGFGGRPNEIYEDADQAASRLLQMAARWRNREAAQALSLRDVRHLVGETQSRLAETLGTDQARVSRLEKPGDVKISTLMRYLNAMGGVLEVRVRFPSFEAPIDLGELTGEPGRLKNHDAA